MPLGVFWGSGFSADDIERGEWSGRLLALSPDTAVSGNSYFLSYPVGWHGEVSV